MSKRPVSVQGAARRARSQDSAARRERALDPQAQRVLDTFQNFTARLGINAGSQLDDSTYGFNPITRNRTMLEWMHRGSWICGLAVDIVADDMTRAGVTVKGLRNPEDGSKLHEMATLLGLWKCLNRGFKWGRLYGGAIGVLLIDGQNVETPLRIETVGRDQFKGILILDRWQVEPSLSNLITDFGPNLGLPKYYKIMRTAPALQGKKVHHSRVMRFSGVELPYQQMLIENMWSLSVLERLYDRLVSFDSATMGASQLVFKSYLRTIKIEGLRKIIAQGGKPMEGLIAYVEMMRQFQTIEGMTMMDMSDEFGENTGASSSMAGINDILLRLGEQLSGATQIPLVRFFGQAPKGLDATGESDLITYYDNINKQQEDYRIPITAAYRCMALSSGVKMDDGFGITFNPLWQLKQDEKSEIASHNVKSITEAYEADIITQKTAMKELKAQAEITGMFGSITDEDIESADDELLSVSQVSQLAASPGEARTRGGPLPPRGGAAARVQPPARAGAVRPGAVRPGVARPRTRDSTLSAVHGLHVVIETPRGHIRRGGAGDNAWEVQLPADYGYIRATEAEDGDQLDCFVGPNPASTRVFVIEQLDNDENFDEYKVMLGYDDQPAAMLDYVNSYDDDASKRMGEVHSYTMDEFKAWMQQYSTSLLAREAGLDAHRA